MRVRNKVWVVAVVVLILAGCSSVKPAPQMGVTPTTSFVSPIDLNHASPLPTPNGPIATPQPGSGTVTGVIFDQAGGKPYAGQYIYLAHLRPLQVANPNEGPAYFAELDVKTDPNARTDADGRFIIRNVEPGEYALAVWLPTLQQELLVDAQTEKNIPVVIKADQITDLGIVKIMGQKY